VSSVQQLLCGLSGEMEVPAATAGEMEDFLAHLETTDKNFNRYTPTVSTLAGVGLGSVWSGY